MCAVIRARANHVKIRQLAMMEYGIRLHVNVYLDIVDSYVVGTAEKESQLFFLTTEISMSLMSLMSLTSLMFLTSLMSLMSLMSLQ